MKQSISADQYKSLSETAQLKWKAWCSEKEYGSVFAEDEFVEMVQPTIGILIEFIKDNNKNLLISYDRNPNYFTIKSTGGNEEIYPELIDGLYDTWKEILEKD